MNYEMLNLESLIRERFDSKSKSIKNIDSEISIEFERLSSLFLRSTVFLSKKQITKFIQGHEHNLLYLLESILSDKDKSEEDTEHIIKNGCLLLKTLIHEFPKAFDFRVKVSLKLLKFFAPEIILNSLLAIKKLKEAKSYSDVLKNILIETITIEKLTGEMISFESINYLSMLIKNILHVAEKTSREKDLFDMLISVNFNKPDFLNYCVNQTNPLILHEKLPEKMLRLIETRKKMQQIIPTVALSYSKKQPKTADFIKDYLNNEICYLHKLSKVIKNFEQENFLESRFKVSLSVKQLALFIQLQVACGIILEEKPKFIHKYIISHYSTSTTERISEKSFKNSYYIHSSEDTKKIIQMLHKMIETAEGYN